MVNFKKVNWTKNKLTKTSIICHLMLTFGKLTF